MIEKFSHTGVLLDENFVCAHSYVCELKDIEVVLIFLFPFDPARRSAKGTATTVVGGGPFCMLWNGDVEIERDKP